MTRARRVAKEERAIKPPCKNTSSGVSTGELANESPARGSQWLRYSSGFDSSAGRHRVRLISDLRFHMMIGSEQRIEHRHDDEREHRTDDHPRHQDDADAVAS